LLCVDRFSENAACPFREKENTVNQCAYGIIYKAKIYFMVKITKNIVVKFSSFYFFVIENCKY